MQSLTIRATVLNYCPKITSERKKGYLKYDSSTDICNVRTKSVWSSHQTNSALLIMQLAISAIQSAILLQYVFGK